MEAQNIIVLKYLLPLETKEDTNTNNISQLTSMSSLSFCLSAAWGPPPSCKAVCWHCNWEITSLSCCSSRLKSATRSVNLQWSQSQLYPGTSLFRCYGSRDYWLEGKSLCSHVHPQNTSLMALYIVASTLAPFPTFKFQDKATFSTWDHHCTHMGGELTDVISLGLIRTHTQCHYSLCIPLYFNLCIPKIHLITNKR